MRRYKEQIDSREASARNLYAAPNSSKDSDTEAMQSCVLIVEDDERDTKLLNEYLRTVNCSLKHAKTGDSALKAIHAVKPDVVLLDIVLPDIDGWSICQKIKGSDHLRNTQVVMLTSLKDMDSRIRGFEAGADDFVLKPIQAEELQARVDALLKKKAYLDGLVNKVSLAVKSSITDALTGLYTHGYLKHFIDLEIKRARRHNHCLSLVMIDVDDFKMFNDTHGHLSGDSALKQLSKVFRNTIRETDLPARYGGEEFSVVLPYTDQTGAQDVAKRIQNAIAHYNASADRDHVPIPSVSMGICVYPDSGIETVEQFIEAADRALYMAKSDGKNCFRLSDQNGATKPSQPQGPQELFKHA